MCSYHHALNLTQFGAELVRGLVKQKTMID